MTVIALWIKFRKSSGMKSSTLMKVRGCADSVAAAILEKPAKGDDAQSVK